MRINLECLLLHISKNLQELIFDQQILFLFLFLERQPTNIITMKDRVQAPNKKQNTK